MPDNKKIIGLLKDTLYAWQQDKGSRLAAAFAYYTVFSITPLLIIIISITGLVFGERAARDEIAYQLEGLIGSEAAAMIQMMLANFENPASGIFTTIVGLGTMVYGATGLFYHVQGALNTIWHAETAVNGFMYHVKQRFIHLAIIFGVGAFLLLSIFTEFVFTAITEYLNLENSPQIHNFILYLVMVAVLFAVLYKILPEVKTAWRDVVLGAAVTSVLFNVGRSLIG
ncbi:MAG: YihY/virulence factor BrkB family protein, partial [Anaerolineales bacterium]